MSSSFRARQTDSFVSVQDQQGQRALQRLRRRRRGSCALAEALEARQLLAVSTYPNGNVPISFGGGGATVTKASPYPSSIAVSGFAGNIADVTVTFNDFHYSGAGTGLAQIDMLLVGPAGQSLVLWSDIGGQVPASQ